MGTVSCLHTATDIADLESGMACPEERGAISVGMAPEGWTDL